jgi:oxalate---CoA ligase
MHGYLDEPAGSGEAFTADGWFRTGDLGYIDRDGYLFLTGRLKEIINRGGQKISPLDVEAALLAHPAVAAAAAFALPDERLGEEVAAAVVARCGMTVELADLHAFAARRLAWHKTPRRIVVVDRLPATRSGKRIRVGLARTLGLVSDPGERGWSRRFVAPATPVERFLAAIWAETLGTPAIGLMDALLDLGGDSLAAARIAARLDQELGATAPIADLLDDLTLGDLAARIERQLQNEADA